MTLTLAATLAYSLEGPLRTLYLPGATSDGHYQIELECGACHTARFTDRQALQAACVRCHAAELAAANDTHPRKKFTDPRNAGRIAVLDARYCVTCHREHRPELTSTMGLSLPPDYCYRCHSEIGSERPSHRGLAFDTCAAGGCHNFHDNRALYEDFLAKHLEDAEPAPVPRSPRRTRHARSPVPLPDAPPSVKLGAPELQAWQGSGHAAHGDGPVGCRSCHARNEATEWKDAVADEVCANCHASEWRGFVASRHGMRRGVGLPALRVADARAPLRANAAEHTLGCGSCHGAHAFDTRRASVDACLGCHEDEHSLAYRGSAHERLWLADDSGASGASCATCHLPRVAGPQTFVEHNQNDNLRPNEKMARGVCMSCHSLGFSLAALADATLVSRNFRDRPAGPARSLELVRSRLVDGAEARPR